MAVNDGLLNFGTVMVVPGEYIASYAYTDGSQMEYAGYAVKGTADSDENWTIRKYTYSSGLLQTERIAKNIAWDDRAGGVYE